MRQAHTPMVVTGVLVCTIAWPVWTVFALVRSPKAESLLWRGRHGWDWVEVE